MHKLAMSLIAVVLLATLAAGSSSSVPVLVRTLDGSGNNLRHPDWGEAGTPYSRVAPVDYADGIGEMAAGPPPRYISNRVFDDTGQNLFSENGVSQWGWVWGQFIDHDFGLRDETPGESAAMAFNRDDPLESFNNDFGVLSFSRTPAAPGTGVTTPRQQINTINSFIDASNVYGVSDSRLDWLRAGAAGDGNPANNKPFLLMSRDNYLPRADARPTVTAPPVDLMGALAATPEKAVVAGDVRANENVALTATHTLFAREHNRIVAALSRSRLSDQDKFQLARRVVGAEIEYITYNEFLPTIGVRLDRYRGYDPNVNPSLENEFATVGFRAHSMIHGEFEPTVPAGTYTADQLDRVFPAEGIAVERDEDGTVTLVIPLVAAFGNPDLLEQVGEGPILESLAERQYKNDEQIDNSLRSVLFQVPKPGATDPASCGAPVVSASCFAGVSDLGADDIQRGRDHGMPSYNDLRKAYGLAPAGSFAEMTGESTDAFPSDRKIRARDPINDPDILDFVRLEDGEGNVLQPGSDEAGEDAVVGVRRTTLAARLKAIYGNVDKVDAFVGMVSEPHVPGTELGPLQLAIWKRQFEALRDGDRFYYENDPILTVIERFYGITYRHTLADLIKRNTGATVAPNVFLAPDDTTGQ
ncbi:MAG TPA: peroxidase family protein [Gaiellaceae bacterium]